jgi:hypothetical protein
MAKAAWRLSLEDEGALIPPDASRLHTVAPPNLFLATSAPDRARARKLRVLCAPYGVSR